MAQYDRAEKCEATKEAEIGARVEALTNTVTSISEVLGAIYSKLASVLTPENKAEVPCSIKDAYSVSPLAERLETEVDRLRKIMARLYSLRDRIEL